MQKQIVKKQHPYSLKISNDAIQSILDQTQQILLSKQLQQRSQINSVKHNQKLMNLMIRTQRISSYKNEQIKQVQQKEPIEKDNFAVLAVLNKQQLLNKERNKKTSQRSHSSNPRRRNRTVFGQPSKNKKQMQSSWVISQVEQHIKGVGDIHTKRRKRKQKKQYRQKQMQIMGALPQPPSFTIDLLRLRMINLESRRQKQKQEQKIKQEQIKEKNRKKRAMAGNIKNFNYDYQGRFYKKQSLKSVKSASQTVIKIKTDVSDTKIVKHLKSNKKNKIQLSNTKLRFRIQKQRALKQLQEQTQKKYFGQNLQNSVEQSQNITKISAEAKGSRIKTDNSMINHQENQKKDEIKKITLDDFKRTSLKFYKFKRGKNHYINSKQQIKKTNRNTNNNLFENNKPGQKLKSQRYIYVDSQVFQNQQSDKLNKNKQKINSARSNINKVVTEPSLNYPKTSRHNTESKQQQKKNQSKYSQEMLSKRKIMADHKIKTLLRYKYNNSSSSRQSDSKNPSTKSSTWQDKINVSNQHLLRQTFLNS